MTGIITLSSGKGGCAKTTSAMAIAGGLKVLGASPVLIDLDYGASLTRAYGYAPDAPVSSLLLEGKLSLEEAVHDTEEGIRLIPTSAGLKEVPRSAMPAWRDRLRELGREHLLVIDTSDDILSAPVAAAILASDILAIPVQLEKKAYDRTFPEIAGLLEAQEASPAQVWFGTLVDKRPALSRHFLKLIANEGIELAVLVPRGIAANEADFKNVSVVASDPKSKVAQAYQELATAIFARLRRLNGAVPGKGGRPTKVAAAAITVNG